MTARRTSRGRSRSRKRVYTDGLQWPLTNIGASNTLFELIGTTAQEFMPAKLDRIIGNMTLANSGSDAATAGVDVGLKIMYVEVNDAQTITGDHKGIDTNEEDIAQRQLWAWHGRLQTMGAAADASDIDVIQFDIDTHGSLTLEPHGKKLLLLIADATAANRAQITGNIRIFLEHG